MHFRAFGSCIYLLKIPELILIDVSSKLAKPELVKDLQQLNINPKEIKTIILTHGHYDHKENLDLFPNAKVYSFSNQEETQKQFPEFKVILTPGHTPDSICILYQDVLFSGDAIFNKEHTCIGRTDFIESNPKEMQKSLEKLKKINYEILCPGHLI